MGADRSAPRVTLARGGPARDRLGYACAAVPHRREPPLSPLPSIEPDRIALPLTPPQAVPETLALCFAPAAATPGGTVVLAHSAGSGPDSDVLLAVGRRLAAHGHAVLSFAFGYRAAGRRLPDPQPRLLSAWSDAVSAARERWGPQRPLVLGGRSMGGRMASLLVAAGRPCDGLVLLAYPLRPARAPRRAGGAAAVPGHGPPRTAHWRDVAPPVLFVSGERDALCDLSELNRERAALPRASQVVVLAGGDHSFTLRARDGRTRAAVLDEVAGAVASWVDARCPRWRLSAAVPGQEEEGRRS